MLRCTYLLLLAGFITLLGGCADPDQAPGETNAVATSEAAQPMTFFVTSMNPGQGADLGGLEGADQICAMLADSVGAGDLTWRAYLSTTTVNARDRIGSGPWHNAEGVQVAANVEELHGENNLTKQTVLTESGQMLNGRGDSPNRHDVLTGSQIDGTSFGDTGADHTCMDWTSSAADGSAFVGHHDRTGGGDNPTSWNAAHASRGCGLENLRSSGGDGRFYCFAADR